MTWDKFMYLVESTSTERYQLLQAGITIHMKKPRVSEHRAICSSARTFITRDKNQVTCDNCKELMK